MCLSADGDAKDGGCQGRGGGRQRRMQSVGCAVREGDPAPALTSECVLPQAIHPDLKRTPRTDTKELSSSLNPHVSSALFRAATSHRSRRQKSVTISFQSIKYRIISCYYYLVYGSKAIFES